MKTRGRPKKLTKAAAPTPVLAEPRKPLPQDDNPARLLVLPKAISSDAVIITLAHPRTLVPTRYCYCPSTGLYEFKKVAAAPTAHRSWLLGPSTGTKEEEEGGGGGTKVEKTVVAQEWAAYEKDEDEDTSEDGSSITNGYISKTAETFIVTPFDPLFLVLSALSPKPAVSRSEPSKGRFLASDDLFESLFEISRHFRDVVASSSTKCLLETRMAAISDMVEAGDESMYRLSMPKLLGELVRKAKKVVSNGLPSSMEDKFITKPLEKPMLALKRENCSLITTITDGRPDSDVAADASTPTADTQASTAPSVTFETQLTINTTVTTPDEAAESGTSPELLELQRLRTALSFMISAYIPAHVAKPLDELLSSAESPINFEPLDEHLAEVAKLRAEALAFRSMGDFTHKRTLEDDEETEDRAEKKRKMEEEEKRKKAGESRAIKNLKKVDVKGMKKMSDFFKKAPENGQGPP